MEGGEAARKPVERLFVKEIALSLLRHELESQGLARAGRGAERRVAWGVGRAAAVGAAGVGASAGARGGQPEAADQARAAQDGPSWDSHHCPHPTRTPWRPYSP